MEHKKVGRPSKGERERLPVRLPKALATSVKAHAASRGMTFNDLVGELLAKEVGVPYQPQGGLKLAG